MDSARWRELDGLLDEVLDLPHEQRAAWVQRQAAELREDLQWLLVQAEELGKDDCFEEGPSLDLNGTAERGVDHSTGVGPYQLIRELGSGGMGTVWLASRVDGQPDREIALKLPRFAFPDAKLAAILERERDILASLNHPNIARLYDAGLTEQGQPWLAMEYVEGQPLDQFCRTRRLGLTARLDLFLQVADAVAHAHARLVIHRDLKPSNIQVDEQGSAHLLDFGIAKILDSQGESDSTVTRLWGAQAMTPDYASPEQLLGQPLTVVTDVYSLGVVLYELLSGQKPYSLSGVPTARLVETIDHGSITRPSSRTEQPATARQLRGDLDTIVLKALKRQPEERYPSVQALVDDIRRFQRGFPVQARPDRFGYVARKFFVRHRWAVAGACVLLTTAGIAAGLVFQQSQLVAVQRQQTQAMQGYLADLIRSSNPVASGPINPTVAELLEQSLADLDRRQDLDLETRFRIKTLLVDGLTRIRGVEATETLVTTVAAQAASALGEDHPVAISARAIELSRHRLPGDLLGNRDQLLELIARARATPGLDREYLLAALESRVNMHNQAWEFPEALETAQESAELAAKLLGSSHPRAINSQLILASAYLRTRENEEALTTARDAFEQVRRIGRDQKRDPLSIESRLIYGDALASNGQMEAAIQLLSGAVEDSLQMYPDQNSRAMTNLGTLARIQDRAGELDAAITNYRRVLERFSGPDKAAEAAILSNLTRSLVAARRHDEALIQGDAWLAATRDVPLTGLPYHTTADAARIALALSFAWHGDGQGARRMLDGISANYPVRRPGSMLDPAYAEGTLATLTGDFDAAVTIHQSSLDHMLAAPAPSHNEMHVRTALGIALFSSGRIEEAAAQLDQALTLYPQYHHHLTPRWADAFEARIKIHGHQGELEKADRMQNLLDDLAGPEQG